MNLRAKARNAPVIYVSVLNFFSSLADYLSLPVLAILFKSHVTLIEVGILMGAPTIVSTFFGFVSHAVNKNFKTSTALAISCVLSSVCYFGFLRVDKFAALFVFALLKGCARVLWIPVTKNLFSLCSKGLQTPENIFKIRYCTICIASIIGPLLCGAIIAVWTNRAAVYAAMFVHLFTLLAVLCGKSKIDIGNEPAPGSDLELMAVFRLPRVDRLLLSYIVGGTLVYLVFSQFEATFSLFLNYYFADPETIFSYLLTLNAVFCLVFQLIFVRFPLRLTNKTILAAGNLLFCISFMMFAAFGGRPAILIAAVFVYSMGEILTIPAIDIAIDEIALPENRTLYFGLSEFRTFGFTVGPIFASFMLEKTNPFWMSISLAVIILFSSFFFVYPRRAGK